MSDSMNEQLAKHTSIFGLRLWVVFCLSVGAVIVVSLFLLSVWIIFRRTNESRNPKASSRNQEIPKASREIQEIVIDHNNVYSGKMQPNPSPDSSSEQLIYGIEKQTFIMKTEDEVSADFARIKIEIGKSQRVVYPGKFDGFDSHGKAMVIQGVSHLGWGHWYSLRELEVSTNGFAVKNVIGEGGYGRVYYGLLQGNSQVAVKNLLNNRGQAEKEFRVEVEAIGRVRHKNLVRLVGYCAEGEHRMLVYEYVNNGNLEQWLHGQRGASNPLTWQIRMHIILGTAKGLSYLHEDLEPKVIHRDIKSSNILLDKQWNPKVSDFGLAKLISPGSSHARTRVMGTFGYVAPEYANSGMVNEGSDVYSFGVLIMEIISGRNPVDYNRHPGEVNLVEWLKKMVADRDLEGVLDPKLPEKPSLRALKRILLVALRCVNADTKQRPKVGHVVHMLEAEQSPFIRDDQRPIGVPVSSTRMLVATK
ncbi:hypothetical protein LIER_06673 [Lithospermum erythrorhizon]|uniref:non-specific serine/threonine protein kinase n=1 Tax=Lithospermum erythrorhizon TaxID=34254 RepID=A0AAV3P958_LITER